MANEVSTAGVLVGYKAESTAGTKPTGAYTLIPNIKATPDLNPEPSNLDVTDLTDTVWKRYIPGLKDPGGSLAFTANNTDGFQAAWTTAIGAYNTAKTTGKTIWFQILIPGLSKAFFFAATPSDLGLKGMEVDAVAEVDVYVTPTQILGWDTKTSVA